MPKNKDKPWRDHIRGPIHYVFDCITCNVHLRDIPESEYNFFMQKHLGRSHVAFGGLQLSSNRKR